jgi:hypothetical protein
MLNQIKYMKPLNPINWIKETEGIENFSLIFVSKRRSGKTAAIKNILYDLKDNYKECYLFSNTAFLQPNLYTFLPKRNIMEYDDNKLSEVYNTQKKYIQEGLKKGKKLENLNRIVIVLDDIMSQNGLRKKTNSLHQLYIEGRHSNVCILTLVQAYKGLSPTIRQNADFSLGMVIKSERDRIAFVEDNLSFNTRKDGLAVYNNVVSKEYQSIVVKNTVGNADPDKQVFTYISKLDIPNYMIGSENEKDGGIGTEQVQTPYSYESKGLYLLEGMKIDKRKKKYF